METKCLAVAPADASTKPITVGRATPRPKRSLAGCSARRERSVPHVRRVAMGFGSECERLERLGGHRRRVPAIGRRCQVAAEGVLRTGARRVAAVTDAAGTENPFALQSPWNSSRPLTTRLLLWMGSRPTKPTRQRGLARALAVRSERHSAATRRSPRLGAAGQRDL